MTNHSSEKATDTGPSVSRALLLLLSCIALACTPGMFTNNHSEVAAAVCVAAVIIITWPTHGRRLLRWFLCDLLHIYCPRNTAAV